MTRSRNIHQRNKHASIGPAGLVLGLSLFALTACAPGSEQDTEVTAEPPVEVSLPASAAIGEVPGDKDQRITAVDAHIAGRVEYRLTGLRWNHSDDYGFRASQPRLSDVGHRFSTQLAHIERVVLVQAEQLPVDRP